MDKKVEHSLTGISDDALLLINSWEHVGDSELLSIVHRIRGEAQKALVASPAASEQETCPTCGSYDPDKRLCVTCHKPFTQHDCGRFVSCPNDPWHTSPIPPQKYTNRHGDPCSEACGQGRHQDCTETFATCHCTYRGLHKTMHLYATMSAPVAPSESQAQPQTDGTYEDLDAQLLYRESQIATLQAEVERLTVLYNNANAIAADWMEQCQTAESKLAKLAPAAVETQTFVNDSGEKCCAACCKPVFQAVAVETAVPAREMNEFVASELAWEVINMAHEATSEQQAFSNAYPRILLRTEQAYNEAAAHVSAAHKATIQQLRALVGLDKYPQFESILQIGQKLIENEATIQKLTEELADVHDYCRQISKSLGHDSGLLAVHVHDLKIEKQELEQRVTALCEGLNSEEFLRKWYEQMKADDPHHFAEHDEDHGDDFPTTYGEYKYDEHFRQCAFVESFLKAASSLLAEVNKNG